MYFLDVYEYWPWVRAVFQAFEDIDCLNKKVTCLKDVHGVLVRPDV